jgi:outer membrane receptor protein involved in Fe transport
MSAFSASSHVPDPITAAAAVALSQAKPCGPRSDSICAKACEIDTQGDCSEEDEGRNCPASVSVIIVVVVVVVVVAAAAAAAAAAAVVVVVDGLLAAADIGSGGRSDAVGSGSGAWAIVLSALDANASDSV